MPEGMRESTVFFPPMTSVCPALCPPWKRATAWALLVSRSTTLPLPSSPHCRPITMRFLPIAGHPQERESDHDADQPAPAQLRRLGLREPRHELLRDSRIDEGQQSFEHQVQSESTPEITPKFRPSHAHGVSAAPGAGVEVC